MADHKLRPGELTDEEKGVLMDSAKASDGASLIVDLVHKVAAAAYEKATKEERRRCAEICNERARQADEMRSMGNMLIRARQLEALDCAAAIEREAK